MLSLLSTHPPTHLLLQADADQLTAAVRTWLKLEASKNLFSIHEQDHPPTHPRVQAAATGLGRLLGRGGASAAFVLGGVDDEGAHLFQVEWVGGWVGGVEWIEESGAVRTSYCEPAVRVGGWVVYER